MPASRSCRAVSLPVCYFGLSLTLFLIPCSGWPPCAGAVVPVVLLWFPWLPATLLLRKATSGHSAQHTRCHSEGSSRERGLLGGLDVCAHWGMY